MLISPHAPRRARSMGMVFEPLLHGDFSRFGHAELSLKLLVSLPYPGSPLRIEVSVLHPPVAIAHVDELDPAHYGVVVEHGKRRGVLLPDIEGIDTVVKQLRIALQKAGIAPDAPYQLRRFQLDKVTRDHDNPRA